MTYDNLLMQSRGEKTENSLSAFFWGLMIFVLFMAVMPVHRAWAEISFVDSGQALGNSASYGVALADLDGDGDLDVFVSNLYNQPNKVWLNNGGGVFTDSGQYLGNLYSHAVKLADLDNDGDIDSFISESDEYSHVSNTIWLNDGLGHFTNSGQQLGSGWYRAVALGDLDEDNDIDAIVATNGPNEVWINNGYGVFNKSQDIGNLWTSGVSLGDLDNDGDLDLFVSNGNGSGSTNANKIWLNNGLAEFIDSGEEIGTSDGRGVALGDVDKDGDIDAIVANYRSCSKIWLNDRHGVFTDSNQCLTQGQEVTLGEINEDSYIDIFISDIYGNKVWLNNGQGVFTETGQVIGSNSIDSALGDLDGDGDLDAFVTTRTINQVWLNQLLQTLVKGSVHDHNRTPLANVIVKIGIKNTKTDTNGQWQISDLLQGQYTATASKDGYTFTAQTLDIDGSTSVVTVNFTANPTLCPDTTCNVAKTGSDTTGDGSETNPFATIQHGIDVAQTGYKVRVHSGTYVENLNFNGKNLTVKSVEGAEKTTIDGNQAESVVKFVSGETAAAVLDGFTLTNGSGTLETPQGGVSGRTHGGGIWVYNNSHPTLRNLIITGNSANHGGGIGLWNNASPYMENIRLTDNYGTWSVLGCWHNANPTVVNATIADNRKGAMWLHDSHPTLVNSIIWNNPYTADTPDREIWLYAGNNTLTLQNSILRNGQNAIYVQSGNVDWQSGNLDADPMFVDAANSDYRLAANSPALGAGTSNGAPTIDLAGNPRPVPAGSQPDMGAYENPLDSPQPVMLFSDVGRIYGLTDDNTLSSLWVDYDDDSDLDLLIISNFVVAHDRTKMVYLYRNDGNSLTDVAVSVGLTEPASTNGIAIGDYDNDGDTDILIGTRLFRNDVNSVGRFTFVATYKDNFIDYDNDSDLDIYGGGWGTSSALYRNDNNIFTAIGGALGLTNHVKHYRSGNWADYDNDGDMDVLLVNGRWEPVTFYRNDFDTTGSFTDITDALGLSAAGTTGYTDGAAWGDYDNDGDLDFYIAAEHGSGNRVYRNDGNTFTDVTAQLGVSFYDGSHGSWGDYDNDGDLDLYVVTVRNHNRLYRNEVGAGNGFVETGEMASNANYVKWGGSWGDFDADGDLDYIVSGDGPEELYRNNLNNGNHWLHFKLIGTVSNRSAIGATVYVKTGSLVQMRNVGSYSYFSSQNTFPLTFGLGKHTAVDTVTIKWPSGIEQILENVSVDQVLTVEETSPGSTSYSVTGIIRDRDGNPLAGINVQIDSQTTITDTTGHWQITDLTQGQYTATATKDGYTFTAQALNIDGTMPQVTLDFTAEPTLYTVEGLVRNTGGNPIVGATVQVGAETTLTNSAGAWAITALTQGDYTAVASADGYTFEVQTISLGTQTTLRVDFIAQATGTLQFSQAALAVSENAGTATATVIRIGGSSGTASVDYSSDSTANTAQAGQDYTSAHGTLVWADGDSATKPITIPLVDDNHAENPEIIFLSLGNAAGATLGTPDTLTLTINDDDPVITSRTTNISTRANISGGANDAYAGFIISGSGTLPVMLRGIAVDSDVDPVLTLLKRNGASWDTVAVNDEWEDDSNAAAVVELAANLHLPDNNGNDAGMLRDLAAGVYTAVLSSNAADGLAVVGVDAVSETTARLINISTRARVSGGADDAYAGFIITGSSTQQTLLRGIAVDSGVDPVITLLKRNGASWDTVAVNDEWEDDNNAAAVGQLAANLHLPDNNGNDAGLLRNLEPGVYTVRLSSNGSPGLAVVGVDVVE